VRVRVTEERVRVTGGRTGGRWRRSRRRRAAEVVVKVVVVVLTIDINFFTVSLPLIHFRCH